MKSSTASPTGKGYPPESGADSGSTGGPANTSAGASGGSSGTSGGASGGYGPGDPLGVGAVWTAPAADREASADRPVLMGGVAVAAVVGLDAGRTLDLIKDLGGLRSWVDAQEAK
ncbi:HNH endonuclease, partial [Arthrobacter sp. HLT1-21]